MLELNEFSEQFYFFKIVDFIFFKCYYREVGKSKREIQYKKTSRNLLTFSLQKDNIIDVAKTKQ